jgi:hypothetical protein
MGTQIHRNVLRLSLSDRKPATQPPSPMRPVTILPVGLGNLHASIMRLSVPYCLMGCMATSRPCKVHQHTGREWHSFTADKMKRIAVRLKHFTVSFVSRGMWVIVWEHWIYLHIHWSCVNLNKKYTRQLKLGFDWRVSTFNVAVQLSTFLSAWNVKVFGSQLGPDICIPHTSVTSSLSLSLSVLPSTCRDNASHCFANDSFHIPSNVFVTIHHTSQNNDYSQDKRLR